MTAREFPKTIHAFSNDVLASHDATTLAQMIHRREVSIREVTEAAILRARQVEPFINGIATEDFEQALIRATRMDNALVRHTDEGFAGVPTLIKDNTDITRLPTCHGTAAITPSRADRTSPFAQQLLAQGFVYLGKSTLPEFGFNATTEPAHTAATRNPWNLGYSAGASSGGAAALVAAGVTPIAHANDGGGSIRIPAACCGLVGLKPTRGRLVDNDAAKALPINIVCDGVVTRTVRDTARFYSQAENWYRNPGLPALGLVEGPSSRPLRIGLVIHSISGHTTDRETRETVQATARHLERMGHTVVPMEAPVPATFPDDFALYWGMLAFGVKTNGRKLIHPSFEKDRVDGLTHGLDRRFRKNALRLPRALWRLHRSSRDYARAMAGLDAILTPTLGHTTPRIGHLSPTVEFDTLFERLREYVGFTPLANTTGAPAIALPMGLTRDNLPISVQLMGLHGGERTLLELAFALEDANPWPLLGTQPITGVAS